MTADEAAQQAHHESVIYLGADSSAWYLLIRRGPDRGLRRIGTEDEARTARKSWMRRRVEALLAAADGEA